jgi:hypothetical protein
MRLGTLVPTHDLARDNLDRKEVTTMRYTKPQIVESGLALAAVQGHPKPTGSALDSGVYDGTIAAYEADE